LANSVRDKVFNYNSETSDTIKRQHFSDVNHHWAQLEVLIYTPTVYVGVSFEAQHFDEIFGVFTDCSTTAESSIQMKRVRDIKSRRLHLVSTTAAKLRCPPLRSLSTPISCAP
jgi:hypothetical protein